MGGPDGGVFVREGGCEPRDAQRRFWGPPRGIRRLAGAPVCCQKQRKGGRDSIEGMIGTARTGVCRPKGLGASSLAASAGRVDSQCGRGLRGPVRASAATGEGRGGLDPDGAEGPNVEPLGFDRLHATGEKEFGAEALAGLRVPEVAVGRVRSAPAARQVPKPGWAMNWSAARRESRVAWELLRGDLSAAAYPGWLLTAAAFAQAGAVDAGVLAGSLAYFGLCLYQRSACDHVLGPVFGSTSGSRGGIGNPWRRMALGRATFPGALARYAVGLAGFVALGQALGVLPFALISAATGALGVPLGAHRHCLLGSAVAAAGVAAQMAAAWGMATSFSPVIWRWIGAMAAASFIWGNVQGLAGGTDGRRAADGTMSPFLGGKDSSCRALALMTAASGPAVLLGLAGPVGASVAARAWQSAGVALCWLVAARLLLYRTPRGLRRTCGLCGDFYGLLHLGALFLPGVGALA
ncbi:unnamed protein product [Ostreobium quekettii]|uniref:Uncharacterized protein n=1 Tax=Ostreobium quekettii TaxID=121088 RepID=A0A8S1JAA7_9CHLO|nr:unnamed protein product [Ostreobium quekettii]